MLLERLTGSKQDRLHLLHVPNVTLYVPSATVGAVQALVFQTCLMSLCLHFIAFDFLYVAEFPVAGCDAMHLAPKRCRVVQHTLDTQHVFFALFHYDGRLYQTHLRSNCSLCVACFARSTGTWYLGLSYSN